MTDDLDAWLKTFSDAWRCPKCGAGVRLPDDRPSEGLLCYCRTRKANLPDHGTTRNVCHDARCGDCGWSGTMSNKTEHPQLCTICDRWTKDCGHTDAERKKHEEDLAWAAHKEADPEVERMNREEKDAAWAEHGTKKGS